MKRPLAYSIAFLMAIISSGTAGVRWTPTSGPGTGGNVNAIAVMGTCLFAGTWNNGVFRSTDTGASWTAVNNSLTDPNIYALTASGGYLFAATYGGGVFRSADSGTTWTAVNSGLSTNNAQCLLVNGPDLLVGTDKGVFLSMNNGGSWIEIDSSLTQRNVMSLSEFNNVLFAGTMSNGVFYSADTGKNWYAFNSGLTDLEVRAFAVYGGYLFAGTWGGGVFRNNGAGWSAGNTGLTNLSNGNLIVNGSNVFASSYGGGVFISPDAGTNWTSATIGLLDLHVTGLAASGNFIFAGTDDGIVSLWQPHAPLLIHCNPDPTYNHRPGFKWYLNDSIAVYRIQIDTNRQFTSPMVSEALTDTVFLPSSDLPLGTLYWRAGNDAGATAWSMVSTVSIIDSVLLAPTLLSATALNDSIVRLSWQNNGFGTVGCLIYRRDSTETAYQFIDSIKSPAQSTYVDSKRLHSATLYSYQVVAYNYSALSDTSNSMQVTTPSTVFKTPKLSISWNQATGAVDIAIIDSSTCEIGYQVFRERNFSSSWNMTFDTVSPTPKNRNVTINWSDSTVTANTWYRYQIWEYNASSGIASNQCMTYTFLYSPQQPPSVIKFQWLNNYVVSTDSGKWSAQSGDSLIIKESSGQYSIVNVSDPANPVSAGTIDSVSLLSYPQKTLIPAILKFRVKNNYGYSRVSRCVVNGYDRVLVVRPSFPWGIFMYGIDSGNNLVYIDSLPTWMYSGYANIKLLPLNDTVLLFQAQYDVSGLAVDFYTVSITSLGFNSPNFIAHSASGYSSSACFMITDLRMRPFVHGTDNQTILLSYDRYQFTRAYFSMCSSYSDSWLNRRLRTIHNIPNDTDVSYYSNTPFVNAYNTGLRFAPGEFLCTNGFFLALNFPYVPGDTVVEVFAASDIRDTLPRATAQSNNAVWTDGFSKQNTLQNIILDTLKKKVYLVYNSYIEILTYQRDPVSGIAQNPLKMPGAKGLRILPGPLSSSVTIVLPAHSRSSDLYFYDLSGRSIDRVLGVTSNAVFWRPKTRTMSCYIVMVKSGREKYTKKFMVR